MTLPNNAPLYVPVIEAWLKKLHYFSEKHTQDVLFSPKFLQNLYFFRQKKQALTATAVHINSTKAPSQSLPKTTPSYTPARRVAGHTAHPPTQSHTALKYPILRKTCKNLC